jgi:hypothetical protein
MTSIESNDPVLLAYQASSEALMAQEEWNPILKLKRLGNFNDKITKAVSLSPDNPEIRFLRLAIEYHIPNFLKSSNHLQEDIDKIFNNMELIRKLNFERDFSRYILYFLKDARLCSSEQLTKLEELIL